MYKFCKFAIQENSTVIELTTSEEKLFPIPFYIKCNDCTAGPLRLHNSLNHLSINNIMLIEDLNARAAERQSTIFETTASGKFANRISQDNIIDAKSKKLIELCECFRLSVRNGTSTSDPSLFTFILGQATSTKDFMVQDRWHEFVKDFKIDAQLKFNRFTMAWKKKSEKSQRVNPFGTW